MKYVLSAIALIVSMLITVALAVIIYYWPVIDRLYVRPCHYYPKAFIDCRKEIE